MDLPLEIVTSIIFHLSRDRGVLLTLCLVSRAFLPESRRCLYRKIAFAEPNQGSYLPYGCFVLELNRNVQFLTTISQRNPSLAHYIHTFGYIFEQNNQDNEDIVVLLNTSLQLMSRLKDLSLFFPRPQLSRFIQGCTFELEILRYIPLVTEWTGDSTDLHKFVISQPSLKRLLLWELNLHVSYPKILWPESTFFHQLNHLTGMAVSVERVFPTCSATSLSLLLVTGEDLRIISRQKFENITSLCLHGFFQQESVIAPLLDHFRNLQILHICGGLSKDFLLVRFSEVLHSLPSLKYYIQSLPVRVDMQRLNYLRGTLVPFLDSNQEEAASWFRVLHCLQAAYIQRLPISEAKCFSVWERGLSEPIEVGAEEVWEISPWV